MRVWVARAFVACIVAFLGYAYWQGTPQDIVDLVRRGDAQGLKSALTREPAWVHTKVYPQAYASQKARSEHFSRTGRDPWEGRYVIHDAVEGANNAVPIVDVLRGAGADLAVRLHGQTLLHLAAARGHTTIATWLLDHGADVNAANDCATPCAERGYRPLHAGLEFRDDTMSALLLARGARVDATGADGRTALHTAAARGKLGGAFVLARHGADLARTDAAGKTPHDLAGIRQPGAEISDADLAKLKAWFAPQGPLDTVSRMARASGSPISDDAARQVFAAHVQAPR